MKRCARVRLVGVALAAWAWSCASVALSAEFARPEDAEFFETRVRPILAERCFACHSVQSESVKGELWLDSREGLDAGGESGPVVAPGQPDQSRLIEAVRYADASFQMPPKGKLPDDEIAVLETWVRAGAPWPNEPPNAARAARAGLNIAERKAAHWCWRPLADPSLPAVVNAAWPRDPLDRFILAALEANHLQPAPPAERRPLIRRLYFDLIGLPPAPEQVARYLADDAPGATERVVDELLASPHFGERWGRHWLDLMRYAETRGHEFDYAIPGAWAYRDYVIRAFNADLPYDQFVVEHLAGDLLAPPRLDPQREINESLLATCSWHLGEWIHSPVDIRADETDRVANQIDVMSKAFLGITLACARCHDHKFDAISTQDFYAFAGFLHSSSGYEIPFQHADHNRAVVAAMHLAEAESQRAVAAVLQAAAQPVVPRLADYLLAVRQIAQEPTPADPDERLARVAACAAASGLNATVLAAWLRETEAARSDPFDPLYAWANVAFDRGAATPLRLAELLKPSIDAWTAEEVRAAQPAPHQLIVDYGRLEAGQWISTGLAFGDRPLPANTLRIGPDAARPIAAASDAACAVCQFADPRLPSMLRTPTFVIESPTLHYQVAGEGSAFVVVDSYRLLEGPLHGSLRKPIKGGDQLAWQSHDVRDYLGHRAHIEFTTAGSQNALRIARVTQGGPSQAEPCRASRLILRALTQTPAETVAAVADSYAGALTSAVAAWTDVPGAAGDSVAPIDQADRAMLVNWLCGRLDLLGYDAAARQRMTPVLDERAQRREQLGQRLRASATAFAMVDATPFDERVLIRGNHRTTGDVAPRRFLEALDAAPIAPRSPDGASRGSGRLELARKIVDPANPLTARVYVNRVWQHLFGRGIVATVDNFGVLGEPPSHPELLDHLSQRWIGEGWSIKRLVRALVLSATYRMASTATAELDARDPDNRWLHKALIKRLEGEPLRDAILAVSGRLDRTQHGPSAPVHLTSFMTGRGRPGESGPLDGHGRRSIYIALRRNFLPPMMLAFDMPVPLSTMGRRNASNVPAQALILLNDPFVIEQARLWAERTLSQAADSTAARVASMYEAAFSRPPSALEQAAVQAFLARQADALGLPESERDRHLALWAELAHVLFNAKEFYFIE